MSKLARFLDDLAFYLSQLVIASLFVIGGYSLLGVILWALGALS